MIPPGSDVLGLMREEMARLKARGFEPAAFVLGSRAWYWACQESHGWNVREYLGLPVLVLPFVHRGFISCVPAGRDGWTSGQRE